jgi:hypothetical protein
MTQSCCCAQAFVSGLTDIPEAARAALAQLTPATYTGNAADQVIGFSCGDAAICILLVRIVHRRWSGAIYAILNCYLTQLSSSERLDSCDTQARALPQQLQQLARKQR